MRVLLVYSNQNRELIMAPPIGLSYVASATRRAGHEVEFLDLLLKRRPLARLEAAVRRFKPEVVGISVRNIDNVVHQRLKGHLGELAAQIATIHRASETRTTLVLGGPAISILGERALKHLDADIAVCGEGEESFPALLAALERGEPLHTVNGLCFRTETGICSTPRKPLASFGASGMEEWIDWRAYQRRGGTWAIQTKRGCPLRCSYCAYPAIEGLRYRRREAGDIVDEIETVTRGIAPRSFEFVDSTFNVPADHAMEICEEIIRRGLRVRLTTMGINPLTVTPELFTLMRRAGFRSMMITPEAASQAMLDSLRKGFSLEHVHRTARLARASGIHSTWFFMLGGPGETRETVEETVSFVECELREGDCLSVFMTGIRILPETELACSAFAEGYLQEGTDLTDSVFYLSPEVSEDWMLKRINQAIKRQPNIVHAAEEGGSLLERLVHRSLHLCGVAPPYWRFLPRLLGFPPLHALRRGQIDASVRVPEG